MITNNEDEDNEILPENENNEVNKSFLIYISIFYFIIQDLLAHQKAKKENRDGKSFNFKVKFCFIFYYLINKLLIRLKNKLPYKILKIFVI